MNTIYLARREGWKGEDFFAGNISLYTPISVVSSVASLVTALFQRCVGCCFDTLPAMYRGLFYYRNTHRLGPELGPSWLRTSLRSIYRLMLGYALFWRCVGCCFGTLPAMYRGLFYYRNTRRLGPKLGLYCLCTMLRSLYGLMLDHLSF